MGDRWHIFFKEPRLHFVRSWTGFCIFKLRVEKHDAEYRITEVCVNRDRRQYGGDDTREDTELWSFLIDRL
jgi:hypothetical protein